MQPAVPQPGIKLTPPAPEAWSVHHWTTGEVPQTVLIIPAIKEVLKSDTGSLPTLFMFEILYFF